jgi:hypothetical protein
MDNINIISFKNKVVKIYPNDTYYKYGKVLDIDNNGVIFEIVKCHEDSGYKVGEIVWISFSCRLTFKLEENN